MASATPRNIIITGASGNLGRVVVEWFLERGDSVFATVSSENSREVLAHHSHLFVFTVDLRDEKATALFFKRVLDRAQEIDAVLLLAGGYEGGDIFSTSLKAIHHQISLNFDTAYNLVQPVFTQMMKQGHGRIIMMSARPAVSPVDGKKMIAYGLSKSLLVKLSEYLNAQAKGSDVTATVVIPSTIDTPANRKSMPSADLQKWVPPKKLAAIFEFILSEDSSPLRETVLKVYNQS